MLKDSEVDSQQGSELFPYIQRTRQTLLLFLWKSFKLKSDACCLSDLELLAGPEIAGEWQHEGRRVQGVDKESKAESVGQSHSQSDAAHLVVEV